MSNANSRFEALEKRLSLIEAKLGFNTVIVGEEIAPVPQERDTPEKSTALPGRSIRQDGRDRIPPHRVTEADGIEFVSSVVRVPESKLPENPPLVLAPWQSVRGEDRSAASATITTMAVGGALSFLLAAAYFIGLIYTTGWLTPVRQIAIASIAGIGFIVAGILFSQRERRYAAYLPAVGIAILFLTSYAAFVMYALISFPVMLVTVAVVSLIALALDRHFHPTIYSVMATVMVYLTPMLAGVEANLTTTIVYYTAWGLLFSFMSLQTGHRLIYLIAMYFAVISFDGSWRFSGQPDWAIAFVFQCVQFVIFGGTAAAFAYIHKKPMSDGESVAHGLPLFFFYITQVILLKQHAPQLVEVFGIVIVGMVIGLYVFGRNRIGSGAGEGATALVSLFVSIVTAHIVFFEILPLVVLPWAVLFIPFAIIAIRSMTELNSAAMTPVLLVTTLLLANGLVMALTETGLFTNQALGADYILFGYAAMLYVCYWFFLHDTKTTNLSPGILYAGHVALLMGILRLVENQLTISVLWAGLAVALLILALRMGDRVMGQSSLLIFIASGVKVVMFDLATSPGPIRISILLVLGGSLYAGGWLYQSLIRKTMIFHSNRTINDQLRSINTLVQQGLSSEQIQHRLVADKIDCAAEGGWTPELIDQIRSDYQLR